MKKITQKNVIIIVILLGLLIFIVGLFIPFGISAEVPYSLAVLVTLWVPNKKYTYAVGVVTSILAVIDVYFGPDDVLHWYSVITTTSMELIAVWASVFVVLLYKRVEEAEGKNKEKMDALFQYTTEGILITNQKGEIVLLNPAVEKMFGYTKDELTGQKIEKLIPDRLGSVHASHHSEYFQTPHARPMGQGMTLFAKRKDGSEFPVAVSLNYFIIEEGKFAIAFLTDITERQEQESIIRHEKERAQRYLDVAPIIFVVISKDGTVARINKEGCHLLGYDEEYIAGKNWFDNFLPNDTMGTDRKNFNRVVLEGNQAVYFYESSILRNDGTQRLIRWKGAPINDNAGNIMAVLCAGEDITEKKKQEEIIRKSSQNLAQYSIALETSNKDLEQFAYVASHDLQEPLRKIQAFGERLKARESEKLSDQGKNYIERMNNAALRMQNLINDLLSFSRITTKAQPFIKVDLNKILLEVLSDMEVTIEKSKAKIEIEKLSSIDADAMQMRQLFQNLISNACKFRREGVLPHIRIFSKTTGNNTIQLLFEDNGIGFEEKYIEKIFNIFERLKGNEYEGSGIGLAICRKIAQRHGGDITAKSQLRKGATFIVTLPVHQLA